MDNFKMVEEALIALNEEKMRRHSVYPYISPISVVASYNIDYLVDIHHFARQYADSHIFYLSWWIDEESAADHSRDFQRRFGFEPRTHLGWLGGWKDFDHNLVYDKFQQIYQIFDDHTKNPTNGYKRCVPLMYPHLSTSEDIRRYYEDHHAVFGYEQCVSIFMTMEIDSNGDVSLCRDYHDYIIGNIKDQTMLDIWTSEKARKFRSSLSTEGLMPVCRRCCGLMGY